jgi:hypothetical protein
MQENYSGHCKSVGNQTPAVQPVVNLLMTAPNTTYAQIFCGILIKEAQKKI